MAKKVIILGLLAVVAAGALAYEFVIAQNGHSRDVIRVSGNIEATDAEVSFKIPGRVVKRLVDEGQKVSDGQLVAQLDDTDLRSEVDLRRAELAAAEAALAELEAGSRVEEKEQARAAMQQAAANLEEMQAGSRPQEIAAAEAAADAAKADLGRAQSEYNRATRLRKENSISVEEFDRARAAYEVADQRARQALQELELRKEGTRKERIEQAQAALAVAKARYDLVLAGPRKETLEQARAKVQQARASLQLAQTRLGYAAIVSPLAGVVLSKNIEPGEYVAPGTPVVTVGDLDHIWLRAYINETDLGRVKLGQKVQVTTDTYPGKVYEGHVSFISSEAEFTPKNVQTEQQRVKLVYRIKVEIDNRNQELKPGMPADAQIVLGSQPQGGK